MVVDPEALVVAIVTIAVFATLCAALFLVVMSLRRPKTVPLIAAVALVTLALVIVLVVPRNVPTIAGLILALLAITLAVIGGNPLTRRVLEVATHGRINETADGGIRVALVDTDEGAAHDPTLSGGSADTRTRVLMRGGSTIGYLERLGVVVAIAAGYPEAIAVVVAIKGIGRFSELASADARERFIIGTLASLVWACLLGGLIRLALW